MIEYTLRQLEVFTAATEQESLTKRKEDTKNAEPGKGKYP